MTVVEGVVLGAAAALLTRKLASIYWPGWFPQKVVRMCHHGLDPDKCIACQVEIAHDMHTLERKQELQNELCRHRVRYPNFDGWRDS